MRVFLTDLSHVDEKELTRLYNSLPPLRREAAKRCSRVNYPQHVVGFCLVRYALRQLDPTADTEHWSIGKNGKPRLAEGALFFNLSHTAHAVAVAVSAKHEVGIDIEEIKPRSGGFAARFFSESEQKAVSEACDPTGELIRIWTAKEAEGKRTGRGLADGIRTISTERVQSSLLTVGGVAHWLSVSPADSMPTLKWVFAEQLQ